MMEARAPPPEESSSSSSARLATALFPHAAEKGGQKDIDREKINSIVMSLTRDSQYTKEKLAHHGEAEKWVAEARKRLGTLDRTRLSVIQHELAKKASLAEARRSRRARCVVDFDMFFAAVEIRDDPALADKPVAVGGIGMISTTNYVARKWGVRSAMPGFVGQQLCRRGPEFGMPKTELVFVRPNYDKYQQVSDVARAIFKEYDPDFHAASLDEACLDLTSYLETKRRRRREGSSSTFDFDGSSSSLSNNNNLNTVDDDDDDDDELADAVLREIRERVSSATGGLTLSGGLGPTFRLAKIAADVKKPNGQFRIGASRDEVLVFLRDLPCRKVGGVGRVLEHKLEAAFDVRTCGELLDSLPKIYHCFTSKKARDFLHSVALGVDEEDENAGAGGDFSVGNERTFAPTRDLGALKTKLKELCALTQSRFHLSLRENGRPRKCALKVKHDNFKVYTKTASAVAPFATSEVLFQRLEPLLDAHMNDHRDAALRLIGLRCFDFEKNKKTQQQTISPNQLTIDETLFFQQKQSNKRHKPDETWRPDARDIDEDVLKELPLDVQRDLRRQIGTGRCAVDKKQQTTLAFPTTTKQSQQPPPGLTDDHSDDAVAARLIDMGFDESSVAAVLRQNPQPKSDLPVLIEALLASSRAACL